jgi:hypothetical protein
VDDAFLEELENKVETLDLKLCAEEVGVRDEHR